MAAAGGKQARAGATPPPRRGARPAPTSPGSAAASGPEFRSAERAAVRAPRGTVSASGGAARKAAAQAGRWGCRGRSSRDADAPGAGPEGCGLDSLPSRARMP